MSTRLPRPALFFDLDGTLWDTIPLCQRAWNATVHEHGYPEINLSLSDVSGIMGLAFEDCARKLFPTLPFEKSGPLTKACLKAHVPLIAREGGQLYPGVREGLKKLALKYDIVLVSNCEEPYLHVFLDQTGFGSLFTDWECHGRTQLPKSGSIKLVLERNSFASTIYIGDTEGDRRAARDAGMRFCFVTYGFGKVEESDLSFSKFTDLVDHFGGASSALITSA